MTPPARLRLESFAGAALFYTAFWLGPLHLVEPFYTYFYIFAWTSYLWIVSRILRLRRPQALPQTGADLLWLLWLSVSLWLVFEVLNFRLKNWAYIGVPMSAPLRWAGYTFGFATVVPGILWTTEVLLSMQKSEAPSLPTLENIKLPTRTLQTIGLAMLILPLLWPKFFFALIWGAFFFLCDPWVHKNGGHSLLADWKQKRWRTTKALFLAGAICGLFWEGCNYGAGAKWFYMLPYVNYLYVFEMPIVGFIGFPFFALEVFAMVQAARITWERMDPSQRRMSAAIITVFWHALYKTIDAWSVRHFRGFLDG